MHLETLTAPTYELLKSISTLDFISSFYLAGGSAAALYLGHRISVDLDFFSILRALVYFSDAEKDTPLKSITPWDWREVKSYFETEVKRLMEKFKSAQ